MVQCCSMLMMRTSGTDVGNGRTGRNKRCENDQNAESRNEVNLNTLFFDHIIEIDESNMRYVLFFCLTTWPEF